MAYIILFGVWFVIAFNVQHNNIIVMVGDWLYKKKKINFNFIYTYYCLLHTIRRIYLTTQRIIVNNIIRRKGLWLRLYLNEALF